MGRVFAYNHHDGFEDDMFIAGHELSAAERWCPMCEEYDDLVGEVISFEGLLDIIGEHKIQLGSGDYIRLIGQYKNFRGMTLKTKERMCIINHVTGFWLDDDVCPEAKMKDEQMIEYIKELLPQLKH